MKNSQVGLIIAAIILAAAAIIYVPQWQAKQQHERDQSGACVLYRQAVSLASQYIALKMQDKAMEQMTRARELQLEGKCTDVL